MPDRIGRRSGPGRRGGWARGLLAVLVVLAGALIAAAPALADGDPASDVLLGQNAFYPYQPPVAPAIQKQLNAVLAGAHTAGFPIKVALIDSGVDLGVIPALFGKPQKYADFLDQEISFQGKQKLLVVMPDGYGVEGLSGPATDAVRGLRKPAGRTSNDLARAAIAAVPKLASAAGITVKPTSTQRSPANSAGGSSSTTILLIALIVAALATATGLVLLRRREARSAAKR